MKRTTITKCLAVSLDLASQHSDKELSEASTGTEVKDWIEGTIGMPHEYGV